MPTPLTIADAAVAIGGDFRKFDADLAAQGGKTQSRLGRLGGAIKRDFGLVAGGAIGGLSVGVLKLGETFDSAYDTIRVGTGATGDALNALEKDFNSVIGTVPDDAALASQVFADLQTRTGLTGTALQGLTKTILDLSRITKTDAVGNVQLATRVFGDWSVATEDQEKTLDGLFRASQSTGIGVDELMGKVVQFGAPLRQMGFSLEESAALLGKWEKEGVNTDAILGALKIGVANFAKEGIDAKTGLQDFLTQMQKLGPGAEATSLAVKTFGSRAGPDMAAAVLEGRFAIGDYLAVIEGGAESIASATSDTQDFGDQFKKLKNQVSAVIGPLATGFGDLASTMGPLIYGLPALGGILGNLLPALGPALAAVGSGIGSLIAAAIPVGMALLPVLLIGAVVAAVAFLIANPEIRDQIATFAGDMVGTLMGFLSGLPGALLDIFGKAFAAVVGTAPGFVGEIVKFILLLPFRIVDLQVKMLELFAGIFTNIIGSVPGFVGRVVGLLFQLPGRLASLGGQIVTTIINGLASLPAKLANTVANAFRTLKIDVGPFHISASGVKIDLPKIDLPKIDLPSFDLPSFAVGTPYVPADMFAAVHQGEMIVPREQSDAIRAGRASLTAGSGGASPAPGRDITVNVYNPVPEPAGTTTRRQLRKLQTSGSAF